MRHNTNQDGEAVAGKAVDADNGYVYSSGFTAINHTSTPDGTLPHPTQSATKSRAKPTTRKRKHNPALSRYLNLGSDDLPSMFDGEQSTAHQKEPQLRKRAKQNDIAPESKKNRTKRKKTSDSDDRLEPTKPTDATAKGSQRNQLADGYRASSSSDTLRNPSSTTLPVATADSPYLNVRKSTQPRFVPRISSTTISDVPSCTIEASRVSNELPNPTPDAEDPVTLKDDEDDPVFDDDIEDILPLIDFDDDILAYSRTDNAVQGHANSELPSEPNVALPEEDDFDDGGLDDEDFLSVQDSPDEVNQSDCQSNIPSDEVHGSIAVVSPPKVSRKFISPVKPQTPGQGQESVAITDRQPIVRPPFPSLARDRSPVVGLSPTQFLRTCFRVGEAVKVGRDAVKHKKNVLIELYARVASSLRTEAKQTFIFHDLFHDKPPYLNGEYAASLWKPVKLYDIDSARLLKGNRMCRCIGHMKQDKDGYKLNVLNIWECTWEDMEWVEGIVNV